MLKKLFRKNEMVAEYFNELKIIYQQDTLMVINYERVISIHSKEVILNKLTIIGENLKVVYQDPIKIKVKGKIITVNKGE